MDLKEILPLGTFRGNRLPGANYQSQEELYKNERGHSIERETTVDE